MKYTTRQTPDGALAGTPFPPFWLRRFSEITPIQTINLLASTCKRVREHLILNVVWKERCKKLKEWETELSEYDREEWVPFEEGVWYEWWCARVIRSIPVKDPGNNLTFEAVSPGVLCSKHGDWNDPNVPILVVISEVKQPYGKRNGSFTYATSLDSLSEIRRTKVVRFQMISKYNNVIRPNGNTAVCMAIIH